MLNFQHLEILAGAGLDLDVPMVLIRSEYFLSEGNKFAWAVLGHLDKGCEEDRLTGHAALSQLLLDHLELDSISFTRLICDKVAELRKDIGANLDHSFMKTGCSHDVEHL